MDGSNIDIKIQKKQQKAKKNQSKAVNIFGNNTEKNEKDNENINQDNEDDMDYFIQGKIVNTDGQNNNNNLNTNVNDNIWEENTKEMNYIDEDEAAEKEEPKKKVIGWGDNVAKTSTVGKVEAKDLFFPDLNDAKAEEKAFAFNEKVKENAKNTGLMRGIGQDDTSGGNWGNNFSNRNKFDEIDNSIRFTNSKGNTEKLNKFMQKEGATYDENLGGDCEAMEDVDQAPIQFKNGGKFKINTEATEADLMRAEFMREVQERAQNEEVKMVERQEEKNQNVTEDRPKFTNSKGQKNAGMFMQYNENVNNGNTVQATTEVKEEKRAFVNSKKGNVNQFMMSGEDQNVPVVATKVQGKLTMSTWD